MSGLLSDDDLGDLLLEYAVIEDHVRVFIAAAKAIDRETLRRSYRYVPRSCLFLPVNSAFKHLFSSANPNDSALSALIRMSRATFDRILLAANPRLCARLDGFTSTRRNRRSRGRAHILDAAGNLGLALTWMATTMHDTPLGIVFGLTNLSRPLQLGKLMLLDALMRIELTACRVAPDQLYASYAALKGTPTYGPCQIAMRLTNLVASHEDNHVQTKTVFQEAFLRGPYGQRIF